MTTIGLYGRKHLQIEEREQELGPPGHNDAIVKIRACGVCGTDLNFLKQWDGDPMPLGHELAGEVVEVGAGVTSVKPGDSVVVEDCTLCGVCADCKNGRSDLCQNMFNLDGQSGMGKYMRLRHNSLVPFQDLDFHHACLTEPLSVCLNSVLNAEIPCNGSVAVLGCGPLGLMTARVAKLRGASFTAITSHDTQSALGRRRLEAAARLGIDLVIDASREDVEAVIKKHCPKGVDAVIASSPPESLYDGLKIIRYGGVVTFYGLHFGGRNKIEIDINDLVFRKITLKPFFAEPAVNFNVSLDLLKRGLVPAEEIVTRTFLPHETREVLGTILERREPVIKAVLLPNG
jgi:L-iditol 2-dehydrogenase